MGMAPSHGHGSMDVDMACDLFTATVDSWRFWCGQQATKPGYERSRHLQYQQPRMTVTHMQLKEQLQEPSRGKSY